MGKESDLYDPLNTKTIGGELRLDVDTYENVQDNIHLEGVNRKLLELTDLIGRVTNNRSDSGPIPDTSQITGVTGADTNQIVTVFTGVSGQVWELVAADFRSNNSSTRAQLRIYVGSDEVEIGDETGHGGTEPFDPKGNFGPIWIDGNGVLKAELTSMAAGREVEINAYLVRVR
jgi:hypothetical protein